MSHPVKIIQFDQYIPGQFADITESSFARKLWAFLSATETVKQMLENSENGKPAVSGLDENIRKIFAHLPDNADPDRHKTLCLNMGKQILQQHGYEHCACSRMPEDSFFFMAGLFSRQ